MTEKIKTAGMAFTGLIIYEALCLMMPYVFSEHTYARLAVFLCVVLLGGSYYKVILGRIEPEMLVDKRFLVTAFGVAVLFTFTSMCTSTLILSSVNDTAFAAQKSGYAEMSNKNVIISLFISVIFAPMAEELIFRGCMFRFLSVFNKTAAMIISSLIFAAYHGTIVHMYAGCVGGLIFCCIYDKTHKLRYSMAAHGTYNLLTIIYGLFSYPDFMTELWWVVILNALLFISLVVLFMCSCEPAVVTRKTERTEKQKREWERTKKIVEEVMNEHKASK